MPLACLQVFGEAPDAKLCDATEALALCLAKATAGMPIAAKVQYDLFLQLAQKGAKDCAPDADVQRRNASTRPGRLAKIVRRPTARRRVPPLLAVARPRIRPRAAAAAARCGRWCVRGRQRRGWARGNRASGRAAIDLAG